MGHDGHRGSDMGVPPESHRTGLNLIKNLIIIPDWVCDYLPDPHSSLPTGGPALLSGMPGYQRDAAGRLVIHEDIGWLSLSPL
jgi:hypothetical protein